MNPHIHNHFSSKTELANSHIRISRCSSRVKAGIRIFGSAFMLVGHSTPTRMVVDPRFYSPFQVELSFVRRTLTVADGNLSRVLDINSNVIFIIKGKNFSLRDRHILLDATGIPILTFQKKHRSIHRRWQAFRGESTSVKDLIFSTKKSSVIQRKITELNVFLSQNKEEIIADFKVVGDWKKRTCTIYSFDGTTILGQASLHAPTNPRKARNGLESSQMLYDDEGIEKGDARIWRNTYYVWITSNLKV